MFLIQENGSLVEMAEQLYDSEDLLQALLEDYPSLLAGDLVNPGAPREWLLVSREVAIPSELGGGAQWAIDHVFLDQDGIPTLVEVKRSTDTRIRREVVGQMLDYAANAVVYWPTEKLRATFEERCRARGLEPGDELRRCFTTDTELEAYWQRVRTNLQAGRVRLVFVADDIPRELRRIIEFLNVQMNPAEVLGIEIKQYVGGALKTLVPRIIGMTGDQDGKTPAVSRQWDEHSFLEELRAKRNAEDVAIAKEIMTWARTKGLELHWGRGGKFGSFSPWVHASGDTVSLMSVWTNGQLQFNFGSWKNRAPFSDPSVQEQLFSQLSGVGTLNLPPEAMAKWPVIRLAQIGKPQQRETFLRTFEWVIERFRSPGDLVNLTVTST
jgi:hypothetical protein